MSPLRAPAELSGLRLLVLDVDEQLLALAEVDAGTDEQTGEGAQALLDAVGHGRRAIRLA